MIFTVPVLLCLFTCSGLENASLRAINLDPNLPPNPTNLTVDSSTETAITFSWTSAGGITSGFVISYKSGSTAPADCTSNTVVPASSISGTTHTVSGLIANTQYSFRLCSTSSSGRLSSGTTKSYVTDSDGLKWYQNRAFVTSLDYDGDDIGGLTGADAICNTRAVAGGLVRTYVALLSSSATDINSNRLYLNDEVYNFSDAVTKSVVATGAVEFWSGSHTGSIEYDETYNARAGGVWSGSFVSGLKSSDTCSDWTSVATQGARGQANLTDNSWFASGSAICSATNALYCVSQGYPSLAINYVTATAVSDTEIQLSWTENGLATDYRIAYQAGAVAPATCSLGTTISESSINETTKTHSVTSLSAGTEYSFRVCAIDSSSPVNESSGATVSATTTSDNLGPNDHRIFITSSTYAPNFGSVAAGDALCAAAASGATTPLVRTYKALISGTGNPVSGRLTLNTGQLYNFSAVTTKVSVKASADQLFDANGLDAVITYDENFTAVAANSRVWTGSSTVGGAGGTCNSWTDNTAGFSGWYGRTGNLSTDWITWGAGAFCNAGSYRLYCISQ